MCSKEGLVRPARMRCRARSLIPARSASCRNDIPRRLAPQRMFRMTEIPWVTHSSTYLAPRNLIVSRSRRVDSSTGQKNTSAHSAAATWKGKNAQVSCQFSFFHSSRREVSGAGSIKGLLAPSTERKQSAEEEGRLQNRSHHGGVAPVAATWLPCHRPGYTPVMTGGQRPDHRRR